MVNEIDDQTPLKGLPAHAFWLLNGVRIINQIAGHWHILPDVIVLVAHSAPAHPRTGPHNAVSGDDTLSRYTALLPICLQQCGQQYQYRTQ